MHKFVNISKVITVFFKGVSCKVCELYPYKAVFNKHDVYPPDYS